MLAVFYKSNPCDPKKTKKKEKKKRRSWCRCCL